MGYYKDLIAYKKAYELAMEIFDLSKKFLSEDHQDLCVQIL